MIKNFSDEKLSYLRLHAVLGGQKKNFYLEKVFTIWGCRMKKQPLWGLAAKLCHLVWEYERKFSSTIYDEQHSVLFILWMSGSGR
jgi:hypothetical protein